MNEFQKALELTTESLQKLKEGGSGLRGSRESLRRLAAARPKAAPAPAAAQSSLAKAAAVAAPPSLEVFPTTGASKEERIQQLRTAVTPCAKCPQLARTRTQTVFGVGSIDAQIMFVGEAPGADEDEQGEPFVGKAGQLLTKIIETMGV